MILREFVLILTLWTIPSASLSCYTCNCPSFNISACDCGRTSVVPEGAHCTIVEDFDAADPYLELTYTFLNSSLLRIQDPYYIVADESVFYNELNSTWETRVNRVVLGCDWDGCNSYNWVAALPDTFNLTIDQNWLTENIYGTESNVTCYNSSNELCANTSSPVNFEISPSDSCDNSSTVSISAATLVQENIVFLAFLVFIAWWMVRY